MEGSVIALMLLALIGAAAALASMSNKLKELKDQHHILGKHTHDLEENVRNLQRFQGIVDIERESSELTKKAQEEADEMIQKAERDRTAIEIKANNYKEYVTKELAQMQTASKESIEQQKRDVEKELNEKRAGYLAEVKSEKLKAKELMAKTSLEFKKSSEQAASIIQNAEDKARSIAGAAWDAKDKAHKYHKAAIAMRNIIRGYGDEYLAPASSVLDDLAEDYSHHEAGQQLKAARLESKRLVKSGAAADCDYKEPRRREDAIHFVIDAFNGKVDSALTKAKKINHGKLGQEFRDAFYLVNLNGKAFKDARITEAYYESRKNELKWAVAAQELQRKDREEQRAIKAAIREEEKAKKEYERAIKQAEKDEKKIENEIAKVRKSLQAANTEERNKYEEEMRKLRERLQEAEDRHKRAESMAQQTRRGHVYIISNIGSFGEGVVKIGMTRRLEPMDRVKELGDASVPFTFDVHAMIFDEDAPTLERRLHERFDQRRVNRINYRKEFFTVSVNELRKEIETIGLNCHWTMAAEAADYRQTCKIKLDEDAARKTQKEEVILANATLEDDPLNLDTYLK